MSINRRNYPPMPGGVNWPNPKDDTVKHTFYFLHQEQLTIEPTELDTTEQELAALRIEVECVPTVFVGVFPDYKTAHWHRMFWLRGRVATAQRNFENLLACYEAMAKELEAQCK